MINSHIARGKHFIFPKNFIQQRVGWMCRQKESLRIMLAQSIIRGAGCTANFCREPRTISCGKTFKWYTFGLTHCPAFVVIHGWRLVYGHHDQSMTLTTRLQLVQCHWLWDQRKPKTVCSNKGSPLIFAFSLLTQWSPTMSCQGCKQHMNSARTIGGKTERLYAAFDAWRRKIYRHWPNMNKYNTILVPDGSRLEAVQFDILMPWCARRALRKRASYNFLVFKAFMHTQLIQYGTTVYSMRENGV